MQIVATLSILVGLFSAMLHKVSAQEAVATFLRSHAEVSGSVVTHYHYGFTLDLTLSLTLITLP